MHSFVGAAREADYLADLRARQARAWPAGMPSQLSYPLGERPLTEYLRERARLHPDRCLLDFYGRQFSYAEIDRLSDRFAAFLLAERIQPGDRVAVMLPNCPQFMIAFYGILKAGAVHVPVSPMFRDEELAYELNDSGARLLLAWDVLMPMISRACAGVPVVAASVAHYLPDEPAFPVPPMVLGEGHSAERAWADVLAAPLPSRWPEPDLDALAALNYTGGTTGMPKGCEHTQRHMLYTAACSVSLRPPAGVADGSAAAVSLVFIPVFWIAGENAALIIPVVAGSACVLLTRWDPAAVLAAVGARGVTSMAATVDNYLELLEHPDFAAADLSTLRAAAAMSFVTKLSAGIRRRWREATGGTLREGAWGMTETHTIDTFLTGLDAGDRDLESRPVFCGLPMPGTELKIASFETGELLPPGGEGEICVRSPSLLRGYWGRPDATAAAVRDGWLHTGDIGLLDEDGCLHFLGRRKEMLKVNGMSVFPSEIEALLSAHPGVAGSGVVGAPDPRRGELPVAFVQLRPGAAVTEEELTAWCREHMAAYKVPRIRFVSELPLTATGKVKKHVLAERLST